MDDKQVGVNKPYAHTSGFLNKPDFSAPRSFGFNCTYLLTISRLMRYTSTPRRLLIQATVYTQVFESPLNPPILGDFETNFGGLGGLALKRLLRSCAIAT